MSACSRFGRAASAEPNIRCLLEALPTLLRGDEVLVVAGTEAVAAVGTSGLERPVLPSRTGAACRNLSHQCGAAVVRVARGR